MTGRGVGTDRFAFLIGNCWVGLVLFDYFFGLSIFYDFYQNFQNFCQNQSKCTRNVETN